MNVQILKKDIKNINIKVKPTGEVVVSAPLKAEDSLIASLLKKRESWIQKKLDYYKENYRVFFKEYVSGENFSYLGKNYRLKVVQSDDERIELQRSYIFLYVKDTDDKTKKEKMLQEWYKEKAKNCFIDLVNYYSKVVKKEVASLKIKEMKTRWGSCNTDKGFINLNLKLIEKPIYCIEYVVLHELAHLVYPHHNKQFYNYLTIHMADWKKRKEKLESL